MIAYAVLMWAIAALFLLLGLLIYHGKTGLIHEYHRERVRSEDMAAYGRAFSTGLFALAGTLVLSGIVPLLWTTSWRGHRFSGGAVRRSCGVVRHSLARPAPL